jgi:DUF1365 family protein
METLDPGGNPVFGAQLDLRRVPLGGGALARALWRWPVMTLQVLARIYWQALRLRLKGIPVFAHPSAVARADEA